MNVGEIMTSPVVTISDDATVGEAAQIILQRSVSCLPVLDGNGVLAGILTHTDFGFHHKFLPMADHLYTLMGSWVSPDTLEEVAREVSTKQVRDVMSKPVLTVRIDDEIAGVADLMVRNNINRFPVLKGDELVGIVTRHDFIKLMTGPN